MIDHALDAQAYYMETLKHINDKYELKEAIMPDTKNTTDADSPREALLAELKPLRKDELHARLVDEIEANATAKRDISRMSSRLGDVEAMYRKENNHSIALRAHLTRREETIESCEQMAADLVQSTCNDKEQTTRYDNFNQPVGVNPPIATDHKELFFRLAGFVQGAAKKT